MEWKIFLNISSRVGSGLRIGLSIGFFGGLQLFGRQQQLAVGVHARAPLGWDECSGAVLRHNRCAGENVSGAQIISPVIGGFSCAVVTRQLHGLLWEERHSARTRSELLARGLVSDSGDATADVYDFDFFSFVVVAVTHFMGAMKREDDVPTS